MDLEQTVLAKASSNFPTVRQLSELKFAVLKSEKLVAEAGNS
jgi:hypothetical protein